jgi:DNA helicase HerA-like ATPase
VAQRYKVQPAVARKRNNVELGPGQREWELLGRLAEVGPKKSVHLGLDYEHVVAIVGKRGSGKSFTLGSFLEGLCTEQSVTPLGVTEHRRAALLFDTLNIFQWMTSEVPTGSTSRHVEAQRRELERWGLAGATDLSVDLWVPAGFEGRVTSRARPFRIRTQEMAAADWAALFGVDSVQDVMGQLVTQVVQNVAVRGWTRASGTAVLPNPEYSIDDLVECLEHDGQIASDYAPGSIRAIRQRFQAYASSPLFGPNGTQLDELLRAGRLSILLLSGIPDDVRLALIYLLIRKLLQARAAASEAAKIAELGFDDDEGERLRIAEILASAPPPAWVVIDEAQNVFPSEKQTSASATLLRFVREGRNFGLSLAFTTQQPTAIDPRIMAQVDTFIVHTLTVDRDITAVRANLKAPEPQSIALEGKQLSLAEGIRQLDVGQAFVSAVDAERSIFVDIRPRVSIHGGFEG